MLRFFLPDPPPTADLVCILEILCACLCVCLSHGKTQRSQACTVLAVPGDPPAAMTLSGRQSDAAGGWKRHFSQALK
jgi:hypothetical protein